MNDKQVKCQICGVMMIFDFKKVASVWSPISHVFCQKCVPQAKDVIEKLINDQVPVEDLTPYLLHQSEVYRNYAKRSYERQNKC